MGFERGRLWTWAAASGLLALTLLPALALARAGGGEGFGGGGGGRGGGGGGGGDGGGGEFLIDLLILLLNYPALGVPVLIIVIIGFVIAQRKGVEAYQGSVIKRGSPVVEAARVRAQLQALITEDLQFKIEVFLGRVRKAFVATQAAWSQQDLTPVRPFLSDGVFERFNIQFSEQKMMGYRDEMADVTVLATDVAKASVDEVFQTLAVRILAQSQDSYVSLSDGKRLSGGDTSTFTEIWTFLRKRGVQSKLNSDGLIEGNCPNCGAAIEMNQNAKCKQCGALLRSGQYDWVLTEITQECEWRPDPEEIPGVANLRQRDSNFAVAALEDTASVMFWRLASARRLRQADPIRKMATNVFCQQFMGALRNDEQRLFYAKCAVGSVHLLGVYQADTWDRAVVEVWWSGARSSINASGEVRELGPIGHARLLLVLGRDGNVISEGDTAISSAHCPNCGAPQVETTANACESCGTVLNDGKLSWVLMRMESGSSTGAQEVMDQLRAGNASLAPQSTAAKGGTILLPWPAAPLPGQAATLAWIVLMAASDGEISPEDQAMLRTAADKWGVPEERLDAMIQSALTSHLAPTQPANADEARTWLAAMVRESLADGKITSREYRLLLTAGQRCGMVGYDCRALIKQTRVKLFAESRGALINLRRGA